jgi:hypothetical protein
MAIKWRNSKIHFEGLDRVDGVFEDLSFPRGFNLAAAPKIGGRAGPFVAAIRRV